LRFSRLAPSRKKRSSYLSGILIVEIMSMPLSTLEMVLSITIIGVAATLQGSVGFGMALVAGPLLALIDPRFIPGALIFSALVLNPLVLRRESVALDVRGLRVSIAGLLLGTLAAALVVVRISERGFAVVFALLVLVAVFMNAVGWRLAPTRSAVLGAAVLGGFMGTIAGINGPPMALVYQDARAERLRSTLAGYFIAAALVSLGSLIAIGHYGLPELGLSLLLAPGVVIGFLISSYIAPHLGGGRVRPLVLLISAASAVALLARYLV
jgi:uncharacterized membrane protein YfcA